MKWEYLVEGLPSCMPAGIGIAKPLGLEELLSTQLNQRGAQGWELVEIMRPAAQAIAMVLVFKRPKS